MAIEEQDKELPALSREVDFVAHCRELGFGVLHEVKIQGGEPVLVREETASPYAAKAERTWKPGKGE